jgi:FkbM family methyltransferase
VGPTPIPDTRTPFGAFQPSGSGLTLLKVAQNAPQNFLGKQIARLARGLYLRGAALPADISIGDMRLRCYLRDNTSERKFVFTPWRFDPLERDTLATSLPADGVFIDIGANVGIYTLSAALLLGARGHIVALEPNPHAYRRLVFNVEATRAARSDWPRIDALEIGVADTAGPAALRIDAGNLGGGSIAGAARFSKQGSQASLTIICRPLLEILAELAITRVDVLKIDVEGAEDVALRPFLLGADESLLPRRLIVENSEPLWKTDLPGAIAARGYRRLMRTRLNTIYAR